MDLELVQSSFVIEDVHVLRDSGLEALLALLLVYYDVPDQHSSETIF